MEIRPDVIDKAMDYLSDFDLYSPYQEELNKIFNYISDLESQLEYVLDSEIQIGGC